jgi:hypothetical protein
LIYRKAFGADLALLAGMTHAKNARRREEQRRFSDRARRARFSAVRRVIDKKTGRAT